AITVTAVNDAPVATAQAVPATEDTPATITLAGADIDSAALTFSVARAPAHGTLSGDAPAITYTPEANYHGPDSFEFVASDGQATSLPATVTIEVASVDDVPTALSFDVAIDEDAVASVTLVGSDADGDAIEFAVTEQ